MTGLKVLVTGGAGFIGSHIVDALLEAGHEVRVLDNLDPQVHGEGAGEAPDYLNREAEFVRGDVRDRDALNRALAGVDAVYHQAAAVGVGQSMYMIRHYTDVNSMGTANLLELIVGGYRDRIRKLVVASSMSIYGEGQYVDPESGEVVVPPPRATSDLEAKRWEPRVPGTGDPAQAAPTPESKPLAPTSIYAIGKRDQEEMVLTVGRAYSIPAVALRYFNVYGARQALSNPYTGVAAIFCARYLNGAGPIIFEDGNQARDFVHVSDIARANVLALTASEADYQAINIGTGMGTTINDVARLLLQRLHPGRLEDPGLQARVTEEFRTGDIRHCFADITRARELLGYEPTRRFEEGLDKLIEWVRTQNAEDRTSEAYQELANRRLV